MGESLKSSRPQTEAMLFARICSFFQKQELAQIDELSVELTDRKEVPGQLTDHTKNLLFSHTSLPKTVRADLSQRNLHLAKRCGNCLRALVFQMF